MADTDLFLQVEKEINKPLPQERKTPPKGPRKRLEWAGREAQGLQDGKIDRKKAGELSRYHASMIADIRAAVRSVGKEISYVRLTPEEKQRLSDLVYSYKRHGVKTSETEILRVGLAFLLEDHQAHGKESVLERMLEALHA